MPEKTPERSQKKENKASAPGLASPDAAPVAADRYIADQLKAMYETVAAEPIRIAFSSCSTVWAATKK